MMQNSGKCVLLMLSAAQLLAVVAPAAAEEPAATGSSGLTATCSVAGYEVLLKNAGQEPWPTGTIVRWSVPFARATGEYIADAPVDPGETVFLASALGSSYLDTRKKCDASLGEVSEPAAVP